MALIPAGGGRIRIWLRGRLRYDLLTPTEQRMVRIGNFAVRTWRERVESGLNSNDQPSKPLATAYARRKARFGGRPIRNLRGVGRGPHMLDNFSVRSVSQSSIRAGFTTTAARLKAKANQDIEEFLEFSPRDQQAIKDYGEAVLVMERLPKLAVQIDK